METRDIDDRLRRARRLARRGEGAAAEREARAALADLKLSAAPSAQAIADAHLTLVQVLLQRGADAEAGLELNQLVRRVDQALDDNAGAPTAELAHAQILQAQALVELAGLARAAGDEPSAQSLTERAINGALRQALVTLEGRSDEQSVADPLARIARSLMAQGEAGHAERLLRLELQERERAGHPMRRTSRARIHLAQCLLRQDKPQEAEGLFRTALEQRTRDGQPQEALTKARCWLAMCVLSQGRAGEAEDLLLSGLSELRELGEHPEARAALRYSLARVNLEQGRPLEAKAMLRRGLEDLASGDDPRALAAHSLGLAQLLHADGAKDEAEGVLLNALRAAEVRGLNPGALQQLREQLARTRGERGGDRSGGDRSGDNSGDAGGTLRGLDPTSIHLPPIP